MPRYLVRRRTGVRSWIWPISNGVAITPGHILDPMGDGELLLEVVLDGMIVEVDDPEGLRGLPVWPFGWRPMGQGWTMDEAIERFARATCVTVPE